MHAYVTESDWPSYMLLLEFTYNSAMHSSTGMPPFHLSQTYCPQIGFEPMPIRSEASEWVLHWTDQLVQAQE